MNGGERDTVEVAVALEQQRTLAIVKAVRDVNFGESPTGMPTPASAAYDLACEEIERRLRTEQWELDGVAAPLPAADAQQVNTAFDGYMHGNYPGMDVQRASFNFNALCAAFTAGQESRNTTLIAALTSPAKVGGDEREAFEHWYEAASMPAESDWFKRETDDPSEYAHGDTHSAWLAWQARAALSADGGEDARDEFIRDVSKQRPEKPDYWSSCGQCQSNIDRAQDLVDAAIAANQAKGDA